MTDVTVLMPVFNGEAYLREAVDSILNQDLTDFEFLIVNDGSTDTSGQILEEYARRDPRIRVLHQENAGIVASLNRGLDEAKGKYIARMDADDVSLRHRLRMQLEALDSNPQAVLVTGGIELISHDGIHMGTEYTPLKARDIHRALWVGNPLYHPSVMFRRDVVRGAGGYCNPEGPTTIEDYDLYLRLAKLGELSALPAILIRYRVNPNGISLPNRKAAKELIRRLADVLWESEQPAVVRPGQFRAWLREYSTAVCLVDDPSRYRRGLQGRLIRDNVGLGIEFIRRGKTSAGLRQLLSVALSGPRGALGVLRRLKLTLKYRLPFRRSASLAGVRGSGAVSLAGDRK